MIVTGSREADIHDRRIIWLALDVLHGHEPIGCIVEGGARGADAYACQWAMEHDVLCHTVQASWRQWGRSAGHRRNAEMLKRFPDARVLAFPRGVSGGTRNCITQARALGRVVTVIELSDPGEWQKMLEGV